MSLREERQFLGGKVRRISLAVIEGKPKGNAPALKRMLLPQGELAQFYSSSEGLRYVAYAELRAGAVRGNHYHKFKQEWIYIISGKLSLVLEDIESGSRDTLTLARGDLAFISTGVAHALHVQESGHAIEFSAIAFDPTDSFPYDLDSSRMAGQ
jgi:quercetin dioxygenase-like cupin family protein